MAPPNCPAAASRSFPLPLSGCFRVPSAVLLLTPPCCCFHWWRLWLFWAQNTALSTVSRVPFGPSKLSRCSLPFVSTASFWLFSGSDGRAASDPSLLLLPLVEALAVLGSRHSFIYGFESAFWPFQMSRCSLPVVPLPLSGCFPLLSAASDPSLLLLPLVPALAGFPAVSGVSFGPSSLQFASPASFWLFSGSVCRAASDPCLLLLPFHLGSRYSFFYGFESAFWPLQMSRCSLPFVSPASFWLS